MAGRTEGGDLTEEEDAEGQAWRDFFSEEGTNVFRYDWKPYYWLKAYEHAAKALEALFGHPGPA